MLKLTDKFVLDPAPTLPLVGWIENPGPWMEAVNEPAVPEFVTVTVCVTGPGVSVEFDAETEGVTVRIGPLPVGGVGLPVPGVWLPSVMLSNTMKFATPPKSTDWATPLNETPCGFQQL